MDYQKIAFTAPWQVVLQDDRFDPDACGPEDLYIRTLYSLISPGTELAMLSGKEGWAKLPCYPGYGSVGTVLKAGTEVKDLKEGDAVFTYGKHAGIARTNVLAASLPTGLDPKLAVFARMAAVSMTALRLGQAVLGEWVAVLGAGLVGNFAAQLFSLAGCRVICLDPAPSRLDLARRCGVEHTVGETGDQALEAVRDLTGGALCTTVVEAIGAPAVAQWAPNLAAPLGEVILLGSPRGEHPADLTEFLNHIHLWGNGCTTFKGAHEWRFPVRGEGHRFTLEKNVAVLLDLIAAGKLQVAPLLSHVLPPAKAQEAYDGLRDNKNDYLGVLFDWA